MQKVVFEDQRSRRVEQILVGEVAGERRVVVAQGGGEQERTLALDREIEAGQVARVAMEQACGAARTGKRVPIVIEDSERVSILKRPRAQLLERSRGRNDELRRGPLYPS